MIVSQCLLDSDSVGEIFHLPHHSKFMSLQIGWVRGKHEPRVAGGVLQLCGLLAELLPAGGRAGGQQDQLGQFEVGGRAWLRSEHAVHE